MDLTKANAFVMYLPPQYQAEGFYHPQIPLRYLFELKLCPSSSDNH